MSSEFNEFNAPWSVDNSATKFDWFILVVDNIPKEIESSLNYQVCEMMDYSFSNNEWVYHQFTIFYSQFLSLIEWHTEVVRNCVYEELSDLEKTGLPHRLDGNRYIVREEIPFLNFNVYTHDEFLERLHEASMDFDVFEEEIIPYLMNGVELFENLKKYFRDTPAMRDLRRLLFRVSSIYIVIYEAIVNNDYGTSWTDVVPDELADFVRRIAHFDELEVDNADYNDIYNEYYVFFVFLIRCYNYNGKLIETYVEGEVVNKDEKVLRDIDLGRL